MRAVWAGFLAAILAAPAIGHHSDAGYNQENVIALEGTVTRFVWRNPHITTFVEVEDANGGTVEWGIETGSTPVMSRSGWTREMFSAGDRVSVRAHPDRNPNRHLAMMISIEDPNGRVWIQDESESEATEQAETIAGAWRGRLPTLGPFREALEEVPLTPAGEAARASYDFRTQSPIARCIPPSTPRVLLATSVYLTEIEILEDRVMIRNEFFDNERTIWTDGRGHPENGERTNQGHSIGHFEGTTLFVDTVNFSDYRTAYGEGVPSGARKHVTERFALSEDRTRLVIDVTVEDPEFLAESFSGRIEWTYTPQLQLYRYDCIPELSSSGQFENND
ncbi:MAG TPA: DUF6152 family protein [Gammaproteobacteria bacterium]